MNDRVIRPRAGILRIPVRSIRRDLAQLREQMGRGLSNSDMQIRLLASAQAIDEARADPGVLLRSIHGQIWFADLAWLGLLSGMSGMSGMGVEVDQPDRLVDRDALAALFVALLPDRFRSAFGGELALLDANARRPRDSIAFMVSWSGEGQAQVATEAAMQAREATRIFGECGWERSNSRSANGSATSHALLATEVAKPICIGSARIERTGLISLRCGDAIAVREFVSREPHNAERWVAALGAERTAPRLILHISGGATPAFYFHSWSTHMSYPTDDQTDLDAESYDEPGEPLGAPESVVDAMEVEVVFSVGTLCASFAQLRSLETGDLLDIRAPARGQVALLVNGKAIAHGELVSIEGQLAVEVLAIGATAIEL